MQNRFGPNRVGPFGFLQPIADGIKSLTKEDIVPRAADQVVHFLAPVVLVVPVFLRFLGVAGRAEHGARSTWMRACSFFFAVGSATEMSVFMAGWSSRNKYSLLRGHARHCADDQLRDPAHPLGRHRAHDGRFALDGEDRRGAGRLFGLVCRTGMFSRPGVLLGFVLFMIAATAESNRSPFDMPEGESEIMAGYFMEYSGFKFALFFLGEYLGMFAISGSGHHAVPGRLDRAVCRSLSWIPSYVWFFGKAAGVDLRVSFGSVARCRGCEWIN